MRVLCLCSFIMRANAQCASGSYLSGGSCVSCPVGHECPTSLAAVACASGTYALGGYTACVTCPPGYACPSTGSAPVQCSAGQYSVGGQATVRGYIDPDWHSCCPAPPPLTRLFLFTLQCTSCPIGRYQNAVGSSNCPICPGGSSCATVASAPASCAAGRYSLDGDASCTQCSPGTYQPSTGQTGCLPCPAGQSCGVRPLADAMLVTAGLCDV